MADNTDDQRFSSMGDDNAHMDDQDSGDVGYADDDMGSDVRSGEAGQEEDTDLGDESDR